MGQVVRFTRKEGAERTRERLVAAADALFVERGFHGASVEDVARRAGVTTGAIYRAFGSKDGLFLAVFDRRIDARIVELEQLLAEPSGPRRTRRAAEQWLARVARDRDWHIALLEFRLHAARSPALNEEFARRHWRFLYAAVTVYDDGATLDGVGSGPAWEGVRALVALGNGYALERLTHPDEVAEEEFASVAATLLEALARQEPPAA